MEYNKGMLKAVIYTRVSTDEQVTNFSLNSQEEHCRKYAKQHNIEIIKVFREEGASAKTILGRPVLRELMRFCQNKKNHGVKILIYKMDRWSRNAGEGLGASAVLAKNGVELISVTEPSEDNAVGKAMRGMLLVFAEFDNNVKSERTKTGMIAAFEKGVWPWKAPIGYMHKTIGGERKLHLIDGYKSVLTSLFKDAASQLYTKTELAERMNKYGFAKIHGRPADSSLIFKILRKRIYYGLMEATQWGITKMGSHEVVTDELTWVKANGLLPSQSQISSKSNSDAYYPLRGFIYCHSCQNPLTASASTNKGRSYPYYHCVGKDCTEPVRWPKKAIEDAFIKYLNKFTISPIQLKLFRSTLLEKLNEKVKEHEIYLDKIKKQLESIRVDKVYAIQANGKGILTDDECRIELERIRSEEVLLELELSDSKYDRNEAEAIINFTEHFLSNVGTYWEQLDLPRKRALQIKIFPKGVYYKEGKFGSDYIAPSFALIKQLTDSSLPMVTPREFESRFSE